MRSTWLAGLRVGARAEVLLEQAGEEGDAAQRVAHLVGHAREHQLELPVPALQRAAHDLQLAREHADLPGGLRRHGRREVPPADAQRRVHQPPQRAGQSPRGEHGDDGERDERHAAGHDAKVRDSRRSGPKKAALPSTPTAPTTWPSWRTGA